MSETEQVQVVTSDHPDEGFTGVGVALGKHSALAIVKHWPPFLEWRLRRVVRRLTNRVFMLARRERDWFMTAGPQTDAPTSNEG